MSTHAFRRSSLVALDFGLRVRGYALRYELEQVTTALMVAVESGFWDRARTAALDLADLLRHARRRADAESCVRGAHCAERIAGLCAQEVRCWPTVVPWRCGSCRS